MAHRPIPEARGFAAALETYLAQGGGRRKSGRSSRGGYRFTEGPIRGKTVDQATAEARRMWRNAPDSVKEKYAGMESSMLAPSEAEVTYAGPGVGSSSVRPEPSVASGPGGLPSNAVATGDGRFYVPGKGIWMGNGVYQSQNRPDLEDGSAGGASPSVQDQLDSNVIGTDEERARIASALNENQDLQTASMGWGVSSAAAAESYERGQADKKARANQEARQAGYGDEVEARRKADADAKAAAMAKNQVEMKEEEDRKIREAAGLPPSAPSAPSAPSEEKSLRGRPPAPKATVTLPEDRSPEFKAALGKQAEYSGEVPSPEPQSDLSGAEQGQVWIGYNADGTRKYQAGDPTKNGPAAPEGYDPRSGSAYVGPGAPPVNAGEPGWLTKAKEEHPDALAAKRKDAAARRRAASIAEHEKMAGDAAEAMADGYKGPKGGADFSGLEPAKPKGEVVRKYQKKAPRAVVVR